MIPLPWLNEESLNIEGSIDFLIKAYDSGMRNSAQQQDYLFNLEATIQLLKDRLKKLKKIKESQLNSNK